MTKPLETYLEHLHVTYEIERRAVVAKVPTPGEPKRVRGQMLYRQDKAVWTDFTGFMMVGGRAIVLEAKMSGLGLVGKEVNPTSFPLSRLAEIQRRRLFQGANAGGISALYIRRTQPGLRISDYLVPALATQRLEITNQHLDVDLFAGQQASRASIKWTSMEPWRIPPGRSWLDAVVLGRCAEFRWPAYQRGGWAALDGPVSSASLDGVT